ncbi:MAG: hypothetical protein MK103_01495 [Planctomycetes bacterium]|nr:hypothetical protein [Planctomycetota bacterium]
MAVFLTLCLMLRWNGFDHEPASAAIYSISQESLPQPPVPTPVESVGKEVTSGLARARTEGTVFEHYARFEVILEAQIEQQDPVTVPVHPLPLEDYDAGSDRLDAVEEGFHWVIQGKGLHTLKLSFSVPVQVSVGGRRLPFPSISPLRATVSSLRLTVSDEVEAWFGEEQQLRVHYDNELGNTVIERFGFPLDKPSLLQWQPRRGLERSEDARLRWELQWLATIQQQRVVNEATVVLNAQPGDVSQFVLRFPSRMELLALELLDNSQPESQTVSEEGSYTHVSVLLQEPVSEALTIRIQLQQKLEGTDDRVMIGGLEIINGDPQQGFLVVRGPAHLDITTSESALVQRIEIGELPRELRDASGSTAFRFSRFPFEVELSLQPRLPRVITDPKLTVHFVRQNDQVVAHLIGKWTFTVQRGLLDGLAFTLAGWEVDRGELSCRKLDALGPLPDQLVDRERSALDENNVLNIEFSRPLEDSFQVEFKATQILSVQRAISMRFPTPQMGPVGQARLSFYIDAGIEMKPRYEAMPLVTSIVVAPDQSHPIPENLPIYYSGPQSYRMRGFNHQFVFELKILESQVRARTVSRVHMQSGITRVTQTFYFSINHAPVSVLHLAVPVALERVRWFHETQSEPLMDAEGNFIAGSRLRKVADGESVQDLIRIALDLPEERMGHFEWSVSYQISTPFGSANERFQEIPLMMADSDSTILNRVEIEASPDVAIQVFDQGKWSVNPGLDPSRQWVLDSLEKEFLVAVKISDRPRFFKGSITIATALLRTMIGSDGRQYYVGFYQIKPDSSFCMIRFPDQASAVAIQSDGRPLTYESYEKNQLKVYFDRPRIIREHSPEHQWVEIRYHIDRLRNGVSLMFSHELQAPQFSGCYWESRWYWEVIVPSRQYLFWSSSSSFPELKWIRYGLFWERESVVSRVDLRSQLKVPQLTNSFPNNSHTYLFSQFGDSTEVQFPPGVVNERTRQVAIRDPAEIVTDENNPPLNAENIKQLNHAIKPWGEDALVQLRVRTVTPTLMVLLGSGAVLFLGWLFLLLPWVFRYPFVLLVFATGSLIAAIFPGSVMLLLQPAVSGFGAVLVLMAVMIKMRHHRNAIQGSLMSLGAPRIVPMASTTAPQGVADGSGVLTVDSEIEANGKGGK